MSSSWTLTDPAESYSRIELQILDLIQETSSLAFHKLYDVTRKRPTPNTLQAFDNIVVSEYCIEQENLIKPFEGTLKMVDLRCLERPFEGDEIEYMEDDVIRFIVAHMADQQHYSLSSQTLIAEINYQETMNVASMRNYVASLIAEGLSNPFEKDLIIFPSFYMYSAYITVVKHPVGVMATGAPGEEKCEVYHFGACRESEINTYIEEVSKPLIVEFLRQCAIQFDQNGLFREANVHHKKYLISNAESYDTTQVILGIIEWLLNAEYEYPDLDEIGNSISTKTERAIKIYAKENRENYMQLVLSTMRESSSLVSQYLLKMRDDILNRHRPRIQDSRVSSTMEGDPSTSA